MLRDPEIGKLVVPIVPDEARTFGMESLFRQVGIYSSRGQLYEPVDVHTLLYYKEAKDGQILEEGITEAGSMASFIAAGSAYATHGINTIPFFIYYSMFGLQRISDFIWAAADMRCRGFMLGGTAGRTTLAGEGLQHQDGNSHILALPIPTMRAYDPAFAYEIAVIIQDGIRRMYKDGENVFYYITVMNEAVRHAADAGRRRGWNPEGHVQIPRVGNEESKLRAQLFGSGAILARGLESAGNSRRKNTASPRTCGASRATRRCTRDGIDAERWNLLHAGEKPRVPYVSQCLANSDGVLVAASDYLKALPNLISRWTPRRLASLGTDGFGRSESREALRDFFEVDARFITLATLYELFREGKIESAVVQKAVKDLDINLDKPNPLFSVKKLWMSARPSSHRKNRGSPTSTVVAALILRDSRILVCQRRARRYPQPAMGISRRQNRTGRNSPGSPGARTSRGTRGRSDHRPGTFSHAASLPRIRAGTPIDFPPGAMSIVPRRCKIWYLRDSSGPNLPTLPKYDFLQGRRGICRVAGVGRQFRWIRLRRTGFSLSDFDCCCRNSIRAG